MFSVCRGVAITIGRLGYVCPHDVAPVLHQFVRQWSVVFFLLLLIFYIIIINLNLTKLFSMYYLDCGWCFGGLLYDLTLPIVLPSRAPSRCVFVRTSTCQTPSAVFYPIALRLGHIFAKLQANSTLYIYLNRILYYIFFIRSLLLVILTVFIFYNIFLSVWIVLTVVLSVINFRVPYKYLLCIPI